MIGYLTDDVKKFGDHLIQGELINLLLVGRKDYPRQNLFGHGGTP